ncbi:MAG: glutathione transferase GstA [Polyangiaceae bacterium]|nr:glutathione transferase GstA [Polyangiaceae bacterium]
MKLYYSPGACSLSPHIVLREAGLSFTLERVDLRNKQIVSGGDYGDVAPKGFVPLLVLDDGERLTEGPAIVQYLADLAPASKLAPPAGTFARYRLQEWLGYISTEIHKQFSPLFSPKAPEEWKEHQRQVLAARFDYVSHALEAKSYLLGDDFTVADAYLFTVLRWTKLVGIDLAKWPVLVAYLERVRARPAVAAAYEAERIKV